MKVSAMPTSSGAVLIVDDEEAVSAVLAGLLSQEGYQPRVASSGEEAMHLLETELADVVITDLQMPGMSGMDVLSRIATQWPDIPVIVLTAHGTIQAAVDAMKAGAQDFMLKPFDRAELLYVVNKVVTKVRRAERTPPQVPEQSGGMVGNSAAMKQVHVLLRHVAPATSTILIRGESGTGKELVAKAIHSLSPRAGSPLIKIHCGALPSELLESELFGYEKGAFTGAVRRKPGRVELGDGGTLFLDEIGDIPLPLQVKLLRLLQEKEFDRLGGRQPIRVDVRFVAATHRDLEQMVQGGQFREDLFYRLNVVPIWIPPLRERREDIGALASHFCATFAKINNRPGIALERSAIELLSEQPWPGNVRQLQNLIERLVVVSDDLAITAQLVERALDHRPPTLSPQSARQLQPSSGSDMQTLETHRREAERAALVTALRQAHNNRSLAARLLGVSRRTLYAKLSEHGMR
jgi:two-component system response regulator AtoC